MRPGTTKPLSPGVSHETGSVTLGAVEGHPITVPLPVRGKAGFHRVAYFGNRELGVVVPTPWDLRKQLHAA